MDEEDLRQRLSVEPLLDAVQKFFDEKFGVSGGSGKKVIEDLTFDGLLDHWKKNKIKKIVTMVGAGISTSAGIPDFRSPGSGLYDNLQKYDLPHPTAIFDMDYFHKNPEPFFALAKELYPGKFLPTAAHYFVRMLHEKGLLVRHYTQNIDTLERVAGIPNEKLVEAHGTFHTSHCLGCNEEYTLEWMKEKIFANKLPTCSTCQAVVKPDIVFFGESMPEDFFTSPLQDFKNCDLLIIMGTSLEVQPFASLIDKAGPDCMRLLINRDKVGLAKDSWFAAGPRLNYDSPNNTRDVAFIGNCDDGVLKIADALGWGKSLRMMIKMEHKVLERQSKGLKTIYVKRHVEPKVTKESVQDGKSSTEVVTEESGLVSYETPTSSKTDETAV